MDSPLLGSIVLAVALSTTVSGCATAYHSKGYTGGFSETVLSPDTFKINFSGNGFTSAERASDFAMLRAADKSLELGCSYFGIVNEADTASVGSVTFGSASWGRGGLWGFSSTAPIVKPNSNLMVKCFKSRPPQGNTFDAHFIAQSIRTKYDIKGAGNKAVTALASAGGETQIEVPASASAAQPAPDVASVVLAAQRVATRQGCGDVHSSGLTTFEASCSDATLIVDCDGANCRPVRMIR